MFAVWSPGGRKLAFLRLGNPEHRGLYVVDADGSGQRKLTRYRYHDVGFAWSPAPKN